MITRLVNIVLFFIMVAFLFAIFLATCVLIPVNSEEPFEEAVYIPYGYSSSQIRLMLEEKGVIRSFNLPFQIMTKVMKIDAKLQSGEYIFSSSQNLIQMIDQLLKGRVVLYRVTIPEGFQSNQIARLLSEKEIADYDEIINLIKIDNDYREGYLFPDTYEFPKNYGALNALKQLRENFNRTVFHHINPDDSFPGNLDFHQLIILASIIEKEAQGLEDKPKIASVFYNRLEEGMRLQSCATIQYILGEPKEFLTQWDLEIESPFNTYLNSGLPPEPICNPGIASILAAAYPAEEEYFYFVLGRDGFHVFSKTYQEHLENKP